MYNKYISIKEKEKYYKKYSNQIVREHNLNFIKQKEKEYKKYFNKMFEGIDKNIKLDKEQIKAILIDEDYEIIIAGAGSGKTTTMAAKVKYLVDKLNINPSDIVIISYTNEAVNELKHRIHNDFNINVNIYTFHKLCLDIIRKNNPEIGILTNNYPIIQNYFKIRRKYYADYLKFNHLKNYVKYHLKQEVNPNDIKLCFDFLNSFKTNGYQDFHTLKKKYYKNKKIYTFILLVEDLYKYYQKDLKDQNRLDFDGMIIQCFKLLDKIHLNYKYLIIDEYQDISYIRFRLIEKISKLNDIKIIVVGDDFQSIYSFSGSDISLFVDFEKLIGKASVLKITNTYRNSQELIDIVGQFVMKNKRQIKKELVSKKHLNHPIVLISYVNNKIKKLELCIKRIINEYGSNKNILVLGRYTYDIDFIVNSNKFKYKENNKIEYTVYPKLNITFLTIHASKGLGFDNVIIVNNENGKYGFPSKVKTNKYLKIINKNSEQFPFAEERRLFYVALTRTKNKAYLLYPKYNPSKFIKEIKNYD